MRAVEVGSPLTLREIEILAQIAQGWSAKEVARVFDITPRTVECHLDAARIRLSARNRTHTVAIALSTELLPSVSASAALSPQLSAANSS